MAWGDVHQWVPSSHGINGVRIRKDGKCAHEDLRSAHGRTVLLCAESSP